MFLWGVLCCVCCVCCVCCACCVSSPLRSLRLQHPSSHTHPNTKNTPPKVVAPKRAALAEANKKLEGANRKLSGIRAKVAELRERVAALEASLVKATEDKNAAVAQVFGGCVCDLSVVCLVMTVRNHHRSTKPLTHPKNQT